MARQVRIEFPGAIYHVMNRGDHQEAIFRGDDDRRLFLKTLGEACEKTGWRIHAWVLMGNHYHMLLETPEPNLVFGMKWFHGTYTSRFNSRHKLFGHLFQGRYKALSVDNEGEHFETVSTYIHLNPLRAGLVRAREGALENYAWSSYLDYLATARKRPEWLEVNRTLGVLGLGKDNVKARQGYRAWMEGRVIECGPGSPGELEAKWRKIRRGWYLGDESFKNRLLSLLDDSITDSGGGSQRNTAQKAHNKRAALEWLKRALAKLELRPATLRKTAKGTPEKLALAWCLRRSFAVSRNWVSDQLHMGHPNRVTLAIRAVDGRADAVAVRIKRRLEKL